jgi:hypothetical protein
MAAARWRIRRMWTIETGLLNAEIIAQAATAATPDPNIHLASAFRALSDDSRSLASNDSMTAPTRLSANCSKNASHSRLNNHTPSKSCGLTPKRNSTCAQQLSPSQSLDLSNIPPPNLPQTRNCETNLPTSQKPEAPSPQPTRSQPTNIQHPKSNIRLQQIRRH